MGRLLISSSAPPCAPSLMHIEARRLEASDFDKDVLPSRLETSSQHAQDFMAAGMND